MLQIPLISYMYVYSLCSYKLCKKRVMKGSDQNGAEKGIFIGAHCTVKPKELCIMQQIVFQHNLLLSKLLEAEFFNTIHGLDIVALQGFAATTTRSLFQVNYNLQSLCPQFARAIRGGHKRKKELNQCEMCGSVQRGVG